MCVSFLSRGIGEKRLTVCLSVYSAIILFVHMGPNNNNAMQVEEEMTCPPDDDRLDSEARAGFNRSFFSLEINMAVNLSKLISITLHQVTTLLRPNRINHSFVWWGFFFIRVQISYWYLVSSSAPGRSELTDLRLATRLIVDRILLDCLVDWL